MAESMRVGVTVGIVAKRIRANRGSFQVGQIIRRYLTLALGIGLMALVFISSRRGYDDPGRSAG